MKKSIITLMVLVAVLASACNVKNGKPQYTEILNATVQINMWVFSDGNSGVQNNLTVEQAQALLRTSPYLTLIQGLGTVVKVDGEAIIFTHNHWGQLGDIGLIQILNANGAVLRSMTRIDFKKLILFQDGGTMLLQAPENLEVTPATMGSFAQEIQGQVVPIVRRQPGTRNKVEIVEAQVDMETTYENQEAWELHALNGDFLAPGDSGGGIWLNGQWIGNTWSIVVIEKANGDMKANGTIYAAQCPAQAFTVVDANQVNLEAEEQESNKTSQKSTEHE